MRSNQKGFSIIEVSIVILVVALVAFAGFYVYNRNHKTVTQEPTSSAQKTTEPTTVKVKNVAVIKTTADLDKASATLDQTNPEDSNTDVTTLDSQLNGL